VSHQNRLRGMFADYLLPQGFPESVAPQYATYMGWRAVQYFFGGGRGGAQYRRCGHRARQAPTACSVAPPACHAAGAPAIALASAQSKKKKITSPGHAGAMSVFTTGSLLGALGVANRRSGEAAAAINWVLKDGAGRLGRFLFARW
jgi:hypothetical protein